MKKAWKEYLNQFIESAMFKATAKRPFRLIIAGADHIVPTEEWFDDIVFAAFPEVRRCWAGMELLHTGDAGVAWAAKLWARMQHGFETQDYSASFRDRNLLNHEIINDADGLLVLWGGACRRTERLLNAARDHGMERIVVFSSLRREQFKRRDQTRDEITQELRRHIADQLGKHMDQSFLEMMQNKVQSYADLQAVKMGSQVRSVDVSSKPDGTLVADIVLEQPVYQLNLTIPDKKKK